MNRNAKAKEAREIAAWILDLADKVDMKAISPNGVKWSYHFPGDLIVLCYRLTGREDMTIEDREIKTSVWYNVARAKLDLQSTLWRGVDGWS